MPIYLGKHYGQQRSKLQNSEKALLSSSNVYIPYETKEQHMSMECILKYVYSVIIALDNKTCL